MTKAKDASALLRAAWIADRNSTTLRWNELEEWVYVLVEQGRVVPWEVALRTLCAALPRVRSAPETFVGDGPAADRPMGAAILTVSLDALSSEEALTLEHSGWRRLRVRRVWCGAESEAALADHAHRASRVAAIARRRPWTYHRSTGWGRLFPPLKIS